MIELSIIIKIVIAHWIGDGLLQTEKMATFKSKSNYWLSAHVGTYMLPFFAMFPALWKWVILMGVIHWVQDFYTSRLNTEYLAKGQNNRFWSSVWTDQMLHYVILFWSITYFL